MQLAMVGLGRMGANLVRRLTRDGHECVVYDLDPAAVAALEREGALGADSLGELVDRLDGPRVVWIIAPGRVRRPDGRRARGADGLPATRSSTAATATTATTSTAPTGSRRSASTTSTSARAAVSSGSSAASA